MSRPVRRRGFVSASVGTDAAAGAGAACAVSTRGGRSRVRSSADAGAGCGEIVAGPRTTVASDPDAAAGGSNTGMADVAGAGVPSGPPANGWVSAYRNLSSYQSLRGDTDDRGVARRLARERVGLGLAVVRQPQRVLVRVRRARILVQHRAARLPDAEGCDVAFLMPARADRILFAGDHAQPADQHHRSQPPIHALHAHSSLRFREAPRGALRAQRSCRTQKAAR